MHNLKCVYFSLSDYQLAMLAYFILLSFLRLTTSYTVIPDDHYYPNATCHCHNLQYYLQNSTKYFTSNTQLLFLPGLYYLNADFAIENAHNISLIGKNHGYNDKSPIIQCNSSVGIIMKNITNLLIENMVIRNCQMQYSPFSVAVTITECSNVKLHYVQIYHTHKKYEISLLGFNIMGNSYLSHITCDEQLYFHYNETNTTINNQVIFLSHYNIMDNFTGRYAVYVGLNQSSYSLTFKISNVTSVKNTFYLYKQNIHLYIVQ